jgi:hypothetical protein
LGSASIAIGNQYSEAEPDCETFNRGNSVFGRYFINAYVRQPHRGLPASWASPICLGIDALDQNLSLRA